MHAVRRAPSWPAPWDGQQQPEQPAANLRDEWRRAAERAGPPCGRQDRTAADRHRPRPPLMRACGTAERCQPEQISPGSGNRAWPSRRKLQHDRRQKAARDRPQEPGVLPAPTVHRRCLHAFRHATGAGTASRFRRFGRPSARRGGGIPHMSASGSARRFSAPREAMRSACAAKPGRRPGKEVRAPGDAAQDRRKRTDGGAGVSCSLPSAATPGRAAPACGCRHGGLPARGATPPSPPCATDHVPSSAKGPARAPPHRGPDQRKGANGGIERRRRTS